MTAAEKRERSLSASSSSNNIASKKPNQSSGNDSQEPTAADDAIPMDDNVAAQESPLTYKLKLGNLGYKITKKLLDAHIKALLPSSTSSSLRIKKAPKWDYAFLSVDSLAAQESYADVIAGTTLKGSVIEVEKLKPESSRPRIAETRAAPRAQQSGSDLRTPSMKLNDQITPLWKQSYANQIEFKLKSVTRTLGRLRRRLIDVQRNKDLTDEQKEIVSYAKNETTFGLEDPPVIASPLINGYRTKCEFSFGRNVEGEKSVGFLLGLYKHGITTVIGTEDALNVPDSAKLIAAEMQKYVRLSLYDNYDRCQKVGFWRVMQVRTPRSAESMVVIQVNPAGVSATDLAAEKEKLVAFFKNNDALTLTTLLLQESIDMHNGINENFPIELLMGPGIVHESILGVDFTISPLSFFQINTPVAELLYTYVRDRCATKSNKLPTLLLDLCCGTGTIGQIIAGMVDKVVGIDLVESAIADARVNAASNGIKNVEYFVGKCEDILGSIILSSVYGITKTESSVAATALDPQPVLDVEKEEAADILPVIDTEKLEMINVRPVLVIEEKEMIDIQPVRVSQKNEATEILSDLVIQKDKATEIQPDFGAERKEIINNKTDIDTEKLEMIDIQPVLDIEKKESTDIQAELDAEKQYAADIKYIDEIEEKEMLENHPDLVFGMEEDADILPEIPFEKIKVTDMQTLLDAAAGHIKYLTPQPELPDPKYNVIAILDPPRAGAHMKVIQSIRACTAVKTVIFIACDCEQSIQNLFDLSRPTTSKFKGKAFRLVKCQAFDMFPHTKQFELLMEFVRD